MNIRTWSTISILVCCLLACFLFDASLAEHPYSGGKTSFVIPRAQIGDRGVFGRPAANLSLTRRGDFFAGNSFFQNAWVTAPASTKARDGLGPLFNTMSCQSCHLKDGRGRPPVQHDEKIISILLRISSPEDSPTSQLERKGIIPHPVYGDQIQNNAIAGLKPEAQLVIEWEEHPGKYPDGKKFSLRSPKISLTDPAYGEIPQDLRKSLRVAPALIGVGLLDTISESDLIANEDPDDQDADGISGRLNRVWDVKSQSKMPGRFGWKAEQPSIRQQVASAFFGDIGITSTLFPHSPLTDHQLEIIKAPNGGEPEVTDEILDLVTFYCKTLAVPAQRSHDSKTILEGKALFKQARCNACHIETFTTGSNEDFPELSEQEIHPYTDLLLHDMGEGLADERPVFNATGQEWKTPPLWGIGLVFRVNRHTNFLHDGRARNFEEAILWHGGEAESSKSAFMNFSNEERRKVLAFLKSL